MPSPSMPPLCSSASTAGYFCNRHTHLLPSPPFSWGGPSSTRLPCSAPLPQVHHAFNRVSHGNFELEGLLGGGIHGKTIGVVGTGLIGYLTSKILAGFGAKLVAFDVFEVRLSATGA